MGRNIHLSDRAVVTHVMVVVRDGDAGGMVPMPIEDFAKLFSTSILRDRTGKVNGFVPLAVTPDGSADR